MQTPLERKLIEALDNVTAEADKMLTAHAAHIAGDAAKRRQQIINNARTLLAEARRPTVQQAADRLFDVMSAISDFWREAGATLSPSAIIGCCDDDTTIRQAVDDALGLYRRAMES